MKLEDFKTGDDVKHRNLGPGTVTDNDGVTLTVAYEGKWEGTEGKYDAGWFKKNPSMLSHR